MEETQEIIIRSEQDAFDTLKLISSDHALSENITLKFDGWPILQMKVSGDGYSSTITPSIMQGFIELQKSLYRAYAVARYNSPNVNKLTHEEKDALELFIEVREGSSNYSIDFQQLLERFVERVGDHMTPKTIIAVTLVVAVTYGGTTAYNSYLEERRLTRIAELQSQEKIAVLEEKKYAGQLEVQRMQILADVVKNEPQAANIKAYSESAHLAMTKSLRRAPQTTLDGLELDDEIASELVKNAPSESFDVRLDGTYRVKVVDSSKIDVFKIKIRDVNTGDEFIAVVQDDTLENKYKEIIQEAEWSKSSVVLTINAKELNGKITQATVLKATRMIEDSD